MATKKASKKTGKKGRVKTVQLKRETIKNLSARDKKQVRGGGGARSGIVERQSQIV